MERSTGKSLYIAARYKALAALSLARIPLPGSFTLDRIISNNTLRLVNVMVSKVYVTSRTAHSTTLGSSRSFLKMSVSLVQTNTLRARYKMYFQLVPLVISSLLIIWEMMDLGTWLR